MTGIVRMLKSSVASLLEAHPIGYWLGVKCLTTTRLLLPHEDDYHAFPLLAGAFPGSFLDLGANQGHSARAFFKLVKGRAAFSVEANPFHRPRLEKIRRRNPGYDFRIAAAGERSGDTLELFTPSYSFIVCHSAAATTMTEARAGIEGVWPRRAHRFRYHRSTTPTIRVDDLGVEPGIIKLDIQGMELPALRGGAGTIRRNRPALLVEIVTNLKDIRDLLAGWDYHPFDFLPGQNLFAPLGGRPRSRNLFFIPAEAVGRLPLAPANGG